MDLTNISEIKEVMSKHGFNFSKSLGQNFIINPTICPKIAEMGNAQKDWGIIEVGTGIGVLTKELALRADKVVAVEIDKRLIPVLDETLAEFDNIKIYNQDIMKTDLQKLISDEFQGLKVAVCANLPYYITSPVIMLLLESNLPIESITVMVQKEAGQRICAEVGSRESGAVTVGVNYYGTAKKLFDVSKGNFLPSPKVDSMVIKINLNNDNKLEPQIEKQFFSIVKAGFSQRRKTIANSLTQIGIPKEKTYSALKSIGLSENSRIEQLNMDNLKDFTTFIVGD